MVKPVAKAELKTYISKAQSQFSDALKRQIKENEVAHNKELERAMDRKNRENLETSIRVKS